MLKERKYYSQRSLRSLINDVRLRTCFLYWIRTSESLKAHITRMVISPKDSGKSHFILKHRDVMESILNFILQLQVTSFKQVFQIIGLQSGMCTPSERQENIRTCISI